MAYEELKFKTLFGKLYILADNYDNAYSSIAKYVLAYENDYSKLTIKQITSNAYTSHATVERFCKIVDADKFSEFKYRLIYENNTFHTSKILTEDNLIIKNIENAIEKTKVNINYNHIKEITQLIRNQKQCVMIGIGSTSLVCTDFVYKLEKLGFIARAHNDTNLSFFASAASKPDDLYFGFSYSGKSKVVFDSLDRAKSNGSKTCLVTSIVNRGEFDRYDYVLYVDSDEKLFRDYTSSARIAMLMVVDLIHFELLKYDESKKFEQRLSKLKLRK